MENIKVLIVDKDVLARQAIARMLQAHPEFTVAGLSGKVENAVRDVSEINPDVLLINVESIKPEDISILTTIRIRFPNLPVIVLSPRSPTGAEVVLLALRLGAVDFITKPENSNNLLFAGRHLSKRLIPIIKAAAEFKHMDKLGYEESRDLSNTNHLFEGDKPSKAESNNTKAFSLVAMGACTGGPDALFKLIPGLPTDFPVPIVIVQHFPKFFTKELAIRLNENSALNVREAYDGAVLEPGTVWIAPGGFHCEVHCEGNKFLLKVHKGPREKGVRPSIDLLFRSATRAFGPSVLACILSGCGEDGLKGAECVWEAGGEVLVQNPRTALARELPLRVIRAGLADAYYPINQFGRQIISRTAGEKQHGPGKRGGNALTTPSGGFNPPGKNKLLTYPK